MLMIMIAIMIAGSCTIALQSIKLRALRDENVLCSAQKLRTVDIDVRVTLYTVDDALAPELHS